MECMRVEKVENVIEKYKLVKQGSTNCGILPSQMEEHGEHGKDGKHQPCGLKNSFYDSKHCIGDSKHSICQPNVSYFTAFMVMVKKNHNIRAGRT